MSSEKRRPEGKGPGALERLRRIAEALPPGGAVTLTRESVFSLLDGEDERGERVQRDLTVTEVAELVVRAESTVRGWLAAGKIGDAYKLMGKEWRVPEAALDDFLAQQRLGPKEPRGEADVISLSGWRSL